tara:strand:- start:1743 stop:2600 length:858 start_codon:yes stop_codon:yes gene_type:complete
MDLPFGRDPASRLLPWTVGLLVFLATLCLALGMFLASAGDNWRRSLSGTLTIQVPAGPEQQASSSAILQLLRGMPEIRNARQIPESEIAKLIEPWLGKMTPTLDLPMPSVIDVTIVDGLSVDIEVLGARLSSIATGTTVDDHAMWLQRLIDLTDIAERILLSVLVFLLLSAVMTVVFTTRTGLAIHGEVIEVLHLIGAQDSYIARQFQIHALWLSGIGAAFGFTFGAGAIMLFQLYGERLTGGLLPYIDLGDIRWGVLCILPIVAVLLVIATSGITVRRILGRMM